MFFYPPLSLKCLSASAIVLGLLCSTNVQAMLESETGVAHSPSIKPTFSAEIHGVLDSEDVRRITGFSGGTNRLITEYVSEGSGDASSGVALSGLASASPVKPKSVSMFPHTFRDVISFSGGPVRSLTVSLPYEYRAVDPKRTRLFFQGEALVIDPATSAYDAYVTYPLRPCIFGRIYDPTTRKSLAFHKYAVHDMKSLRPYFVRLSPSNPETLQVTLFTCEMSPAMGATHAPSFGKKTQTQELNAVRSFLTKELLIPEDNIERRFLRDGTFKDMPHLGQYEFTPVTVGVGKTGEVFHTGIFSCDFFGVGGKSTPPRIRNKKGGAQTICALPPQEKPPMMQTAADSILGAVQSQYDTDLSRNTYWSRNFYSADDRMDVPAATLGDMFGIRFEDKQMVRRDIFASTSSSSADKSALVVGAGAASEKKVAKKEGKKKKG